jgi:hypothetical protein
MRNSALASARNSLVTKIIKPVVLITAMVLYVFAAPVWAGVSSDAKKWYDTCSTAGKFTISNAKELTYLAEYVNTGNSSGGNDFSGKEITLSDSINLSGSSWTPIGHSSAPFRGTFNGNNRTIEGLSINSTQTEYGLFGNIDSIGKVQNLKLKIVNINGSSNVGGVAGVNAGTVEKCTVTISGTISGNSNIGGIAGVNRGTVSECTVSGGNIGKDGATNVGGLVGNNASGARLEDSTVNAVSITGQSNTTGALAGINAGTVDDNDVYTTVSVNGPQVNADNLNTLAVGTTTSTGITSHTSIIDTSGGEGEGGGGSGCDAGFGGFAGIAALGAAAVFHGKRRRRI